MKNISASALTGLLLFLPFTAAAQVTSGTTEVTTDGIAKAAVRTEEVEDATELAVQGGALSSAGNSRSLAITSSTRFLLRRGRHETGATAAANYARAAQPESDQMETTIENYQGRIRYDYFLTRRLSLFLAIQGRRDRFQGLDFRLGIDPGVSYSFIRDKDVRLWTEVGYDYQYDVLTDETLELAETEGTPREKSEDDHNARFFLGYDHKLGDRLAFVAGAEVLKSFIQPGWRLDFNAELRTKLAGNFSLAVGTKTLYNSVPLPGVEKLDVVNSLSFVYTVW